MQNSSIIRQNGFKTAVDSSSEHKCDGRSSVTIEEKKQVSENIFKN